MILKKEEPSTTRPAPSVPSASPADRRRAERQALDKPVTLIVESDRERISQGAYGIDLSTLGIRVRAGVDLLPGQLVTVIPNEGAERAVPSRVVWVGEEGSKRAGEAGIVFLEPLTLEA
ncbi:MAG TPA: PilZ domain-containing protein [Terriglobia bacterium]|nr:PilZ domain-containing protein [Terriglobia bacterium]